MQSVERIYDMSRDNGVALILLLCFSMIVFAFALGGGFESLNPSRILSIKDRSSIFTKTSIFSGRINLVLNIQFMLTLGVFLAATFPSLYQTRPLDANGSLYALVISVVVAVSLSVWVRIVGMLGRLFAGKEEMRLWLRDFFTLAGGTSVLFFAVTVVTVYVSSMNQWGGWIGVGLLVIFKLITIYKGVMLFFGNLYSLFYLILYLCALEMIPLLLLQKGIAYLLNIA